MGLSARFSAHAEIRAQGTAFAKESKRLLIADLEHICLANIQACILIGNLCGADANADSESLFFGIAMRMARILHLAVNVPPEDAIRRETECRVWWSLYMIDTWCSAGLGLPRQFCNDHGNPDLPKDDIAFHRSSNSEPDISINAHKPGLWAHMIVLAEIFSHIQDLNHHLASDDLGEDHIESSVSRLAERLQEFESKLPQDVQFNAANLAAYARQGRGRTFVALHLGFYHYGTLLYFQYLDTPRSASPTRAHYAHRCRHHAAAFSDLLRMSYDTDGCAAEYFIVAHMTVVSSSVLLHTLLFGEDEELAEARRRLESNFEVLIKLRDLWPNVRTIMNRLFMFQNACFWSASPNTHKIDRWMVKFLLQHALVLDEKIDEQESPGSTRSNADIPMTEAQRLSERGRITRSALSGLLVEYPSV